MDDVTSRVFEFKDYANEVNNHGVIQAGSVLVIDDCAQVSFGRTELRYVHCTVPLKFLQEMTQDVVRTALVYATKFKITIFILAQNLFTDNNHYRQLSSNFHFLHVLKIQSPLLTLRTWAQRSALTSVPFLLHAYLLAMRYQRFGYLIIANHVKISPLLRFSTRWFPDQFPLCVFIES